MADNTTLNTGSGGDVIRDILRVSGAKTQVVQLDAGGQAGESLVSQANPLPVQLMDGAGAIPAAVDNLGNLSNTPQTSYDAPVFNVPVGSPDGNFAGMPLFEGLMDDDPSMRLNTRIVNLPKSDTTGALVLSDCPAPIPLVGAVGAQIVLDLQGYQSLLITTQALAGTITVSNELGGPWSAPSISNIIAAASVAAIAASSNYIAPKLARYFRITVTTAGTGTAYLSTSAVPPDVHSFTPISISLYAGTAAVTGGVAGLPGVGGNIGPGVARTANPVPIGGTDSANLTRVLLMDTSGRPQVNMYALDPTTNTVAQPSVVYPTGSKSVPALAVQNLDQAEGLGLAELLSQILLELKISNHYAYLLQQAGIGAPDDPSTFRGDPSIFQ